MNDHLLAGVTDACLSAHAEVMAAEGLVLTPRLVVVRDGQLIGYVTLRPVYVGKDAVDAVGQMSHLAAAAEADEVFAVWETQDLAAACDHVPLHPDTALNVVHANPDKHVLYRHPYREWRLPGRTSSGMAKAKPQWLSPHPPAPEAELEPAIAGMLHFCWEPFDTGSKIRVEAAAAYLIEQRYTVQLTAPASEA
ncbi:hypothetical protein ACQEVF_57255 [Nonomuraea polychroma]|uniref:hypothetical protein n=1 Tax=Nonomuraea polychroma TaxID=46176 RepID=UPI003D8F9524